MAEVKIVEASRPIGSVYTYCPKDYVVKVGSDTNGDPVVLVDGGPRRRAQGVEFRDSGTIRNLIVALEAVALGMEKGHIESRRGSE